MAEPPDEARVIDGLRAGDERVFTALVRALQPTLRRVARGYLRDDALVDEVLQDAWLAVLGGIAGFEGRSSLKTWICRIVINRARTSAVRAARSVPLSSLGPEDEAAAVDPDRFRGDGHWARPPAPWEDEDPARIASRKELLALVDQGLDELPERQRLVVTLRDVQGWTAEEVCNALEIAETNQRVLLHRGRARLREILETKLAMTGTAP